MTTDSCMRKPEKRLGMDRSYVFKSMVISLFGFRSLVQQIDADFDFR